MHGFARNDARCFYVDARTPRRFDRTLGVDRIAERVNHAAEHFLADGHVDDRAGALDRLAFLDVAVGAENDDADIVALEVERHAAHARLELDHLACLHIVEPIDTGNAVTDGENLADFRDFGLIAEVGDLVLEDRGNLCRADIHQPTSFIRVRIEFSLVRTDPSTMREPSLTTMPPMIPGSTLVVTSTSLPPVTSRSVRCRSALCSSESGCATVTSARVTPRSASCSLSKSRIIGSMAKRRRFDATSFKKLAVMPEMPVLAKIASSALTCASAEMTGLRISRRRSALSFAISRKVLSAAETSSVALFSLASSYRAVA